MQNRIYSVERNAFDFPNVGVDDLQALGWLKIIAEPLHIHHRQFMAQLDQSLGQRGSDISASASQ